MNLGIKNNMTGFYEFCLFRIIFSNYSFTFFQLKYFLKFTSSFVYSSIFFYFLRKNIFKYFYKSSQKFFLNLNLKELYYKIIHIKNTGFPTLNTSFKLKKSINLFKRLNFSRKPKITNFLFFVNEFITFNKVKPSIQLILFFKSSKIIENSIFKNEIRVSNMGINHTLDDPNIQFIKILEIFSRKKFLLLDNICKKNESFFSVFFFDDKISYKFDLYTILESVTKNDMIKLWIEIKEDMSLKAKLIHSFSSKYNYIFWFLHEIKVLFFPRFSDKFFILKNRLQLEKLKPNNLLSKKKRSKLAEKFHIIIESNYRIYAYNDNISNFLNSILLQFFDLIYNLPNLFVGEITKISINRAIKRKISTKSIIGFLEKNLHQICKNIPYTVLNQIRAWGLEQQTTIINECLITFSTLNKKKKKKFYWNLKFKPNKIKNKIYILKKNNVFN
nr:TATA binding protein of transcription factor IIB-like protein [Cryptomonas curvata]